MCNRNYRKFQVKVGLHQGSVLSPFLFAVTMDRLTDEVWREPPWTMLFADDIVICKETRKEVERRLESWKYALARRGIKVSRSKTEYLCMNGGNDDETVKMEYDETITSARPVGMGLPRAAWVRLNRLRTGIGRFHSSMHKWGLASSPNCECGASEQTADHVLTACPIHRAPHGARGLTVLDDETRCWLNDITASI